MATWLIVGGIVASSCGSVGGTAEADPCKLPELAPGEIPSPDEVLPPREECPELYEPGDGSAPLPPVPDYDNPVGPPEVPDPGDPRDPEPYVPPPDEPSPYGPDEQDCSDTVLC
ncbi:MAG TPA: hypothetical protein VHJ37_07395 [Thermoleophilaceae bacterium]|jgi:hypothetical protein|nr:hypothetical protein [Thermoleophilaceae bacterium]